MNSSKKKNSKLKKILLPIIIVVLVAAVCSSAWTAYVKNYYHALDQATEAVESPATGVMITENEDGSITFSPEDPTAGVIFYPGAKVEYTAYAPLMSSLAQMGYLCVLVQMPQNMAILDINAADGIRENYPEITEWYMAGHSMGGAMAATYLKKHADSFAGLILLAAFSDSNLSDTDLRVLSIYGSEDGVLGLEKYEKRKVNLPEDFTEFVIDGGCHAYFGCYGPQKGDGRPTISNREQIQATADQIHAWISTSED